MQDKRILIIDESGFAHVCSALFENAGCRAEVITDVGNLACQIDNREFDLVVTSHPYGTSCLREMTRKNIPIILLLANIDENIIDAIKVFDNCYCMIKPLDYEKFRSLASQLMSGNLISRGGFHVI